MSTESWEPDKADRGEGGVGPPQAGDGTTELSTATYPVADESPGFAPPSSLDGGQQQAQPSGWASPAAAPPQSPQQSPPPGQAASWSSPAASEQAPVAPPVAPPAQISNHVSNHGGQAGAGWGYGAAAGSAGFGATSQLPAGPPRQYRADAPRRGETAPAGPPAAAAVANGEAPPTVTPAPGWGWRALVAFMAGGALTASGFAVAQLGGGSSDITATGTTTSTVSTSSVTEAADVTETTVEQSTTSLPPAPAAVEPAAHVADVLGPSVVQIETNFGIGSGVVYQDDLVITNHHVVAGAEELTVVLSDGRAIPGQLLGSSAEVDIAVVQVEPGQGLQPATFALGEVPTVGQAAVAIGSPFRLQQSVTEGIVSAINRPVPNGNIFVAMIQTDAPINPGNSGGALADRQGRVIGINTAIQTGGTDNSNAGVGFAIPIDTAVNVADKIIAGTPIEAGFLGVAGGPTADGSSGVEVTEITEGSAAEEAGIQVGDRILSIDGAPVITFEELAGLVVANSPGEVVELEVVRGEEEMTISATLGQREEGE